MRGLRAETATGAVFEAICRLSLLERIEGARVLLLRLLDLGAGVLILERLTSSDRL
jgi:hypothetical protein